MICHSCNFNTSVWLAQVLVLIYLQARIEVTHKASLWAFGGVLCAQGTGSSEHVKVDVLAPMGSVYFHLDSNTEEYALAVPKEPGVQRRAR